MKMVRTRRCMALFMAVLVITIPFYSTFVMGDSTLRIKKASGKDGVGSETGAYRRYNDELTIEVEASITGDTQITNDQVRISINDELDFNIDSCTGSGQATTCKYVESGYRSGTQYYQVKLYDDSNSPLRSEGVEVTTDRLGAAVKSLSINPKLSKDGKVSLDYRAEDYASDQGDTSRCAGIKKIEFYKDDLKGQLLKTIEPEAADCVVTGQEDYSAGATAGTYRICAKATDQFDQSSTSSACGSFEIDNKAPAIKGSSLLRMDSERPLRAVAYSEIPCILIINVSGTDMNGGSVRADLAQLHDYVEYGNTTPNSIDVINGNTILRWDVDVQLKQTRTPVVKVYGTDLAGNSITPSSVSLPQITFDVTGPVFNSISTKTGQAGDYWLVGKNTTFVASISENAGNLENLNVFLDLTGLGLEIEKADSCVSSSGGYTCYWYSIMVARPSGTVAEVGSTLDSMDDLGNKADSTQTISVRVDTAGPVVSDIRIDSVHGEVVVPGINYTAKGDKLAIYANVTDESEITALGNFSSIIKGATKIEGACTQLTDSNWQCVWNTDPIEKSGPFTAKLFFTFKDYVGNRLTVSRDIGVVGILNETNPYYWDLSVRCSPSKIDREVTTLAEQRVYCNLHLEPVVPSAETAGFSFDDNACTNAMSDSESLDYVRGITILNAVRGSKDPYLKIALKTTTMNVDELKFTCPLEIFTFVPAPKPYIVQNPQRENVTIQIFFYNMPLGEFSSGVEQKIEDVKNDVTVKMKMLGTLTKWLNFARTVCNIIQTYNRLVQTLNEIAVAIGLVEKALPYLKPFGIALRETTNAVDTVKDDWTGTVYKFCMYVSCDVTLWGSWYNGYVNSMQGKIDAKTKGGVYNVFGNAKLAENRLDWMNSGHFKGQMWPQSPKDSLVLSIATGCIPGIIDGLQRWRQIQCNYGICLQESANQRIPLKACEDQKAYLECKFIYGEIFQIVPYANFFKGIGNMIYTMVSDPLSLVFSITTVLCGPLVFNSESFFLCVAVKYISELSRVAVDLQNAWDSIQNMFKPANDMCEALLGES